MLLAGVEFCWRAPKKTALRLNLRLHLPFRAMPPHASSLTELRQPCLDVSHVRVALYSLRISLQERNKQQAKEGKREGRRHGSSSDSRKKQKLRAFCANSRDWKVAAGPEAVALQAPVTRHCQKVMIGQVCKR